MLVGAKFLPYARVAVTMTAGASHLRLRTFVAFSIVAATVYTVFHVVIGSVTGAIFASNPLMALLTSIVLGLILAGIIGLVAQRISQGRQGPA